MSLSLSIDAYGCPLSAAKKFHISLIAVSYKTNCVYSNIFLVRGEFLTWSGEEATSTVTTAAAMSRWRRWLLGLRQPLSALARARSSGEEAEEAGDGKKWSHNSRANPFFLSLSPPEAVWTLDIRHWGVWNSNGFGDIALAERRRGGGGDVFAVDGGGCKHFRY